MGRPEEFPPQPVQSSLRLTGVIHVFFLLKYAGISSESLSSQSTFLILKGTKQACYKNIWSYAWKAKCPIFQAIVSSY